MFKCKICAAEMVKSHGNIRAKELWIDKELTAIYNKTGYSPSIGHYTSSGHEIIDIKSNSDSILLIIKKEEK